MSSPSTLSGIGLGHRPELAADLLARPALVDFVEVTAEACMANPLARREALACRAIWPVALHGVKLSLGSADGIDDDHARRLGRLARELDAPLVSEHVAFTRAGSREIGHLTRTPYSRGAVEVIARNVARARRALPDIPLLLENVAATLAWPDDELDEPDFHAELVRRTGCDLLLDVGNLYANAVNAGRDPIDQLLRFPLDRVAMLHVAGGAWEEGFYFDTHADPIPDPVFDLIATAIARVGAVPILLERDAAFGCFNGLVTELDRLRTIVGDAPPRTLEPIVAAPLLGPALASEALTAAQCELADALVAVNEPTQGLCDRFGAAALARSRAILTRKRIDDALPHLPRLSTRGPGIRELAAAALAGRPRAPTRASTTDAWRIAELASGDPDLRDDAAIDALPLRARFHPPRGEGSVRPRRGPFVGHLRAGRRSLWAFKGLGATATVHLVHPAERRGAPP